MRVCMASGIPLYDFVMRGMQRIKNIDLLILGFGTVPRMSYIAEIEGEQDYFADLCTISKNLDCVLICAADTDLYGIQHKSMAVIDKGRLVNITDMVNIGNSEFYSPGYEYNVYRTTAGKIGILVDNDLYNYNSDVLVNSGCNYIVSAVDGKYSEGIELVVKSNALDKADILCSCLDYSFWESREGYRKEYGEGVFEFDFIQD